MYTDSSKTGFRGTFKDQYIVGLFPESWQLLDIQFLELYPIFLLIHVFAPKLAHHHVVFHSDNQAVVSVINSQTSKSKLMMQLLRPMVLLLLKYDIKFNAVHIPGITNTLCDLLSRQRINPDILRTFRMKLTPTAVPHSLRSHNWKLEQTI